ncbi:phosphoribosyltransferase family protein [Vulgatibacter sp.]|uniref:phosphoribosyltransferase family protein n=1 Tax=Vulgatibacter sp. TaxID=1971226 RepID=UPI003569E705
MTRYQDRIDAGRQLGRLLAPRIDGPVIVFGVPRAGVQVAAPVAEYLHAPLMPVLVRKVGLPEQPDVVVGAIDADGSMVFARTGRDSGLLPGETESMGEDVAMRLLRWRQYFGTPDPATVLQGHVAVVVDDAVISGLTTESAVGFLQRRGASRIVVAVPAGLDASLQRLEKLGAEVVCPLRVKTAAEITAAYDHLPEVSAEEVAHLLARGGPSRPQGVDAEPLAERSVRLVDGAAVSHKAILRLPTGMGPNPAVVLAGSGTEPGTSTGEVLAVRLAEAGIASIRLHLAGGAAAAAVLELALDVLSARPEVDAFRLGLLVAEEAAGAGVEVGEHDRRVAALALLDPPGGVEPPDRCLVVQGGAFDPRAIDRIARWFGDRLRPA